MALWRDGLAYPCFASRADIQRALADVPAEDIAHDPDGAPIYPGLYRDLAPAEARRRIEAGAPYALRLNMAKALAHLAQRQRSLPPIHVIEPAAAGGGPSYRLVQRPPAPQLWGDPIIARKDVPTSYHLACVADDASQNVSLVVRGRELSAATCVHWVLQSLLGLPHPIYYFHDLVLRSDGEKFSKRDHDLSLAELRASGVTPAMIARWLGFAG